MTLILLLVLGGVGVLLLFVVPWIGAALFIAALALGGAVFLVSLSRGGDVAQEEHHEQPEVPHLPGPGNPVRGVE